MKVKAFTSLVVLAGFVFAGAQNTVRFSHHYKEGDKDTYKMQIAGSLAQGGDVSVHITMTETVKKVYDNGDVDLFVEYPDSSVEMGGNQMPYPMASRTQKVDKDGIPKDSESSANSGFTKYLTGFFDRDLKPGDVVTVDTSDPKNPKDKTSGTITLDSITNGEAKLICKVTHVNPALDRPSNFNITFYMNAADSKIDKMEGTVDSWPVQSGIVLNDVKASMERLKS